MDITSDKYRSDGNRLGLFAAVWKGMLDIVRRVSGFFALTEEDRLKAGIYVGGEGREG
jgi:hypothetical protein